MKVDVWVPDFFFGDANGVDVTLKKRKGSFLFFKKKLYSGLMKKTK